MKFIKSAEIQI